jgi:peroxiredoxin
MAIVLNKPLPEFEANATSGLKVSNISHVGQTVVLFFYPKDNTPGCTTEAMQFRDKYKDFVKAGALVLGVSRDNMKSHDDFKAKLELPFRTHCGHGRKDVSHVWCSQKQNHVRQKSQRHRAQYFFGRP